MRFIKERVEKGRVINGQQPSWKKWVKKVEKGFNAVPSKVTSMKLCKWSKSIGYWLGSLTSNVTPILKDWNLFNNLINYFNNFDIITTQWWMHSKKPINLVLGILYLNYTLEIFFAFYKLILWNTKRLCILIMKPSTVILAKKSAWFLDRPCCFWCFLSYSLSI